MPVTYQVDLESSLIHTRCTGDVTFAEVLAHFRELEADPGVPAGVDVQLDLSEMRSLPETGQLRAVAGRLERLKPRVKWGAFAIVAGRDALFGMIRVFQVIAEEHFADSAVFRDRDEAQLWLASVRSSSALPS